MRSRLLIPAAIAVLALAVFVAACGDDNSGRRKQPLRHDRDRRFEHGRAAHGGSGGAVPRGEPGREDHGRHLRHGRRLREVLCRRDRHLRRLAPDRAGRDRRLQEGRTSPTRRSRSPTTGIAIVVNPDNDWATCLTAAELKKIWDKGSDVNNWNQVKVGLPRPGDEAVRRRAPTRARSTTSPSRSTVRRDAAAPTTARPRTTTSRSRACPATRATWATSGSPTRSRTRAR